MIVVVDCVGFYVNCILVLYINEVVCCLLDGEFIVLVDKVLVDFGFLVGLIILLDEVGIDVGIKIIFILVEKLGVCFVVLFFFDVILKDGWKGCKNGCGFYFYFVKSSGFKWKRSFVK